MNTSVGIIRGSDRIIKGIINLDDVQQDLGTEIDGLKITAYDSYNVEINKWGYPAGQSGYTDIILDSDKNPIIYLEGSKTSGKNVGSIKWRVIFEIVNTYFSDNQYDLIKEYYFGVLR